MRYTSLFFDLDDTLLDTSGDEIKSIKKTFDRFGIPYTDDIEYLYRNRVDWQCYTMGKYDEKSVFTNKLGQVLDMVGVKANREEMAAAYFEYFKKAHRVIPGVKKMLETLKNKGYRLYITANGYSLVQGKKLVDTGLDGYFNGIFLSDDIDLRKPTKAFFDYVFGRVPESKRSKVLIIGDAQSTDVLGAKNAGMDCCWYNPSRSNPKYKSTYEVDRISDISALLCK